MGTAGTQVADRVDPESAHHMSRPTSPFRILPVARAHPAHVEPLPTSQSFDPTPRNRRIGRLRTIPPFRQRSVLPSSEQTGPRAVGFHDQSVRRYRFRLRPSDRGSGSSGHSRGTTMYPSTSPSISQREGRRQQRYAASVHVTASSASSRRLRPIPFAAMVEACESVRSRSRLRTTPCASARKVDSSGRVGTETRRLRSVGDERSDAVISSAPKSWITVADPKRLATDAGDVGYDPGRPYPVALPSSTRS